MENKIFVIDYLEYDSLEDMNPQDAELMRKAMEATEQAYAPYSGFSVGAALRLSNGLIVTGSNQENIAYPSGLCAERVAMFSAAHQYPDTAFDALAIVGRDKDGLFVEASPCGSCRQVMSQYEMRHHNNMKILLYAKEGKIRRIGGVKYLLPFAFDADL